MWQNTLVSKKRAILTKVFEKAQPFLEHTELYLEVIQAPNTSEETIDSYIDMITDILSKIKTTKDTQEILITLKKTKKIRDEEKDDVEKAEKEADELLKSLE